MSIRGAAAYKKIGNQSTAEFASPHRLIQMLLDGALEKMVIAKSHMERGNVSGKGENISWSIKIIGGLQASIDKNKGGEIAETLSGIYDYLVSKLSEANIKNDIGILDECILVIKNIKEGWDGISDEAEKIHSQQNVNAE